MSTGLIVGHRRATEALWGLLSILFLAEALHELVGLGGSGGDRFFNRGVFNLLILGSGAICLLRAATIDRLRGAWALIGLSLISFGIGAVIWTFHFAEIHPEPPHEPPPAARSEPAAGEHPAEPAHAGTERARVVSSFS